MYSSNGIFYTEEHAVSFGDLIKKSSGGTTHTEFDTIANSWEDWHLIPSSLPIIVNPGVVTKYIEVPGADGVLDLSDFLVGRPTYNQRQGSLTFIMDTSQESDKSIRFKMLEVLQGKKLKMQLMDDPSWYYEGRFSVGAIEIGKDHPKVTINYQLDPFKYHITPYGSELTVWDTFNFEEDYDYSAMYPSISVNGTSKSFSIYTENYPVTPTATWISGNVTVSFGGVTVTLNSAGTATLGTIVNSSSSLVVSGTGSVLVEWRGGSL